MMSLVKDLKEWCSQYEGYTILSSVTNPVYSTVTLFAKFLGLSMSKPLLAAT